jgi:triosephosphate isomerase
MNGKLIAGNWKMNKTPAEAKKMIEELIPLVKDSDNSVVVAPSFVCLPAALEAAKGSNIYVAAQNMAEHEEGAYTGEVSVLMLKDLGIPAVILGHSERRQYYGETDAVINTKTRLALQHGLEVILCIGETLTEREAGKAFEVVRRQLKEALTEVTDGEIKKVSVAYEPVWAIGTGKTASSADAEAVHVEIRKMLAELYSEAAAKAVPVVYGGSVKPDNIKELMGMPNIDGALVGGASLKADSFGALVNFNREF